MLFACVILLYEKFVVAANLKFLPLDYKYEKTVL